MAKRGRYGAGSYYSAQLKSGEKRYWWIAPASRTGKRQKSPRFSDADALEDWIADFRKSNGATARRGTFDDAAEAWLNDSDAADDKLGQMRGTVANHFLPVFGGKQLGEITTQDVNTYASGKATGKLPIRGNAKPRLGRTTIHMHVGWIRAIYEHAIETDTYFGKNPAARSASKKLRGLKPVKERAKIIGDEDLAKLIKAAPPMHRAHIAVLGLCGLRSQEAAGLYWRDWNRSTLQITQVRRAGGREIEGYDEARDAARGKSGGKTDHAIRNVPLSKQVDDMIKAHKRHLADIGLPNSKSKTAKDLMFPDERGGVVDPHNFRRALRKIAEEAGVEQDVTPHMLRHSAATRNLRSKPLAEVSDLLGHADKSITAKIYIHNEGGSPVEEIELDPKRARAKAKRDNYANRPEKPHTTRARTSGGKTTRKSAEA